MFISAGGPYRLPQCDITSVPTMRVLAILSDALLHRLQCSMGTPHTLTRATADELSADGADLSGRLLHADLIVVEPEQLLRVNGAGARGHIRWPLGKTVLYTTLSPAGVRATLELLSRGGYPVVLSGADDSPALMRETMESAAAGEGATKLMWVLGSRVGRLPKPLQEAVRNAARSPRRYTTVDALSRSTGISRRSLDRWFQRAGLHSPRRLLQVTRVACASYLARHTTHDMAEIARHVGIRSERQLRTEVRQATRMTLSSLRAHIDEEHLLRSLLSYVLSDDEAMLRGGRKLDQNANAAPNGG